MAAMAPTSATRHEDLSVRQLGMIIRRQEQRCARETALLGALNQVRDLMRLQHVKKFGELQVEARVREAFTVLLDAANGKGGA